MLRIKNYIISKKSTIIHLIVECIMFGIVVLTMQQSYKLYKNKSLLALNPIGNFNNWNLDQVFTQEDPIVFFGDSRIYDWDLPEFRNITTLNCGVNGQTSMQCLLRYNLLFTQKKPSIVVFQLGFNDLKTIPLVKKVSKKQQIVDNCKNNILKIVQNAQGDSVKIILTTIFPVKNNVPLLRKPIWSSEVEKSIETVNDFILTLEDSTKGVFVLNTYVLLKQRGRTLDRYYSDFVHLNRLGYLFLNEALLGKLVGWGLISKNNIIYNYEEKS